MSHFGYWGDLHEDHPGHTEGKQVYGSVTEALKTPQQVARRPRDFFKSFEVGSALEGMYTPEI